MKKIISLFISLLLICTSCSNNESAKLDNPFSNKINSVNKLFEVGELNLTNDDLINIEGIDFYVLMVKDNSALLMSKDVYDVSFDEGNHECTCNDYHNESNNECPLNYLEKLADYLPENELCTYNYNFSSLKNFLDNFYKETLHSNEYILNSEVNYYYLDSYSEELLKFNLSTLSQYVFALDAKLASEYASYFNSNGTNLFSTYTTACMNFNDGGILPLSLDSGYGYFGNINGVGSDYEFGVRPCLWLSLN